MFSRRRILFVFITLLIGGQISSATSRAEEAKKDTPTWPKEQSRTYTDPGNVSRTYLVQEPITIPDKPTIFIYMHGAAHKEEQGMLPKWANRTFSRLRPLMAKWGWIYVCPRDGEFVGLLKHLRATYKPGAIYLSGASAGGRVAYLEAKRNPSEYAGLLLMCPAIRLKAATMPKVAKLTMPIWIVSGDQDKRIHKVCKRLDLALSQQMKAHRFITIPGGDHGAPIETVRWQKALTYLVKHAGTSVEGKATPDQKATP